jgi:gluconokinase
VDRGSDEPGHRDAGPSGEVIIGLDVGTTATKAVAFELGTDWRYTALREYLLSAPQPGWQVQDPRAISTAVVEALAECVAAVGDVPVVAVSVSTAMHGLVGLDDQRVPLTSLITWADARSADEARGLRASHLAAELYRASGTPIHPMTPLTKIMWYARREPVFSSRVRWWAGLKDFVLSTLVDEVVTELSSASGTAMIDMATRDWNPLAVDLAGISLEQLPPILPTTTTRGLSPTVAAAVGLPAGLPVVVGAGDGPLGNVGTGAMTPGVAGLSLGTSGAVRMAVPQPTLDPAGRLFCYALTDTQWIMGGAVSNGGVVVRWAGEVFGRGLAASDGRTHDAELLALAETVPPGSDGLLMLPFLLAERAPLWDPDLAGAYLGVRHRHTTGHFVRATVEGVALQLSTIVESLDRIAPVTSLRATGGALRSMLWRRVLAAAIGRPLTVTTGAEGSALGVAALGLVGLGRAADLGEALEALNPASATPPIEIPEVSSPAEVALYKGLRASVPGLLAAYDEVARLFT